MASLFIEKAQQFGLGERWVKLTSLPSLMLAELDNNGIILILRSAALPINTKTTRKFHNIECLISRVP